VAYVSFVSLHICCASIAEFFTVPSHQGDDVHDGCTYVILDADDILETDISHFCVWMYIQSNIENF
jgi:hypothetical protein